MARLSELRQQQALRYVEQPHRLAAILSEGNTDCPFPPKIAAPHQEPDQPAGVPRAGGPHSALQRDLGGSGQQRGHRRRGCSHIKTSLAFLGHTPLLLPFPREGAHRRQIWPPPLPDSWPYQKRRQGFACVSTTPVSETGPRSARRAAHIRKTNRPAAGPYIAAAAGPPHTCCPPPSLCVAISHCHVFFIGKKFNFSARFKEQF
jgi:hypothetical protein